jgi:Family of unknown function (DUF6262)
MRADNTPFIVQAARQRSQATRQRAVRALRKLAADGTPITFDAVARTAGVSRSWLYGQPDLRAEVERLRALTAHTPVSPPVPARQRASDASLRRRLEAVNAEIRRLREENRQLREQLAWAHGEVRAARSRGPVGHEGMPMRSGSATIGPCS